MAIKPYNYSKDETIELYKNALKAKLKVKLIKGKILELKSDCNYVMLLGSNNWMPSQNDVDNIRDLLKETTGGANVGIAILPNPNGNSVKIKKLPKQEEKIKRAEVKTLKDKLKYKIGGRREKRA
jgi:hypothetical protein